MGDLTPNLSRYEFACKCGCGFDIVDHQLAEILQSTADHFYDEAPHSSILRVAIVINSGCRCPAHNIAENGSENSRHTRGCAADFKLYYVMRTGKRVQIPPDRVANYLDTTFSGMYGVGWYRGRTHFDTSSSGKRRWDKR